MVPETTQPGEIMSEDTIRAALDSVRARIADAERQRAECDRVIAAGREEERLLLRLLALRHGDATEPESGPSQAAAPSPDSETPVSKHQSLQVVVDELSAAGRPIHISELMRLLRERNTPIPGAGTQANLIAHLRRDRRVVRPSRGMYALASSGLENMPPAGRRRRRTKRKRVRVSVKGTDA